VTSGMASCSERPSSGSADPQGQPLLGEGQWSKSRGDRSADPQGQPLHREGHRPKSCDVTVVARSTNLAVTPSQFSSAWVSQLLHDAAASWKSRTPQYALRMSRMLQVLFDATAALHEMQRRQIFQTRPGLWVTTAKKKTAAVASAPLLQRRHGGKKLYHAHKRVGGNKVGSR